LCNLSFEFVSSNKHAAKPNAVYQAHADCGTELGQTVLQSAATFMMSHYSETSN